ncbi:MAG: Gfo/Idh/MocA family oxidoreductase [Isosphaeraceae bacterium]|nr:Gfo/Idh/MocA family oxidoreductase [Isosphaeraceae bacterium]
MGSPSIIPDAPNAALIGGGFIGPVHVEALRRIGIPVVGILGSAPERVRPLARQLGIPRVYEDLDDLVGDGSVAVVHVTSPNGAHFDQTCRLLESGRHVVCEKPLAVTAAETTALCALARSRPRQAAAVNYNVRFYPLCHEMRSRIARGDIGRVLSVTGSYTQDWLLYPDDYNWRVEPDGGTNLRAVADIGTHWMDLAQFVVGQRIRAVCADLATFHAQRFRPIGPAETFRGSGDAGSSRPIAITTDDYAAVLLRIGAEARGSFHVSQMTAGRKNRVLLEVAGTEGSFSWDSEEPNGLWIGRRKGPSEWLERDPALLSPEAAAISDYPGGHAEGFPDTFKQLFRAVYQWIGEAGATSPAFPTFDDGDREVRLCEAIARSAHEQRWVTVEAVRVNESSAKGCTP